MSGGGIHSRDAVGAILCPPHAPLQDDEEVSEFALDGLKQVMAVKSRVVLPYLVPKVHLHTWHTPHSRPPLHIQCWQDECKELKCSLVFQDEWAPWGQQGSRLP